jgi:hypothetical protein
MNKKLRNVRKKHRRNVKRVKAKQKAGRQKAKKKG